ncbi:MAG: hypothetical protein D6744_09530 [Planctomycetota bacterium]|nr:MAG: hypothetical protein D6744_09530 [Planctomycetota bacterium]
MRFVVTILVAVEILGASIGCGPRVEIHYGPRIELSDLAANVRPAENGFALLQSAASRGRFACSLAIAMFVPGDERGEEKLTLAAMQDADEAWWTEILRGVAEIQDVQFLTPIGVRPETASIETLCRRAARREAALLLVFAPNRYGPNAAQVFGVIYDTQSCTPLVSLHAARAWDGAEETGDAVDQMPGLHREEDAVFQTRREFEQHVLAAIAKLVAADQPPTTPQSHQWRKPVEERWWLPRR